MNLNLQGKVGGLPKWMWLVLLGGGVGVGLYLRSRPSEPASEEVAEETEVPVAPDTMGAYEETSAAGGLQALGIAGPVAGRSYPVEAPFVPEGFTEVIGTQGETIQSLSNGVLETAGYQADTVASLLENRPQDREIIRERIGHTPTRKPSHKPPAKPKPKKPKPQAKNPKGKKKGKKGK